MGQAVEKSSVRSKHAELVVCWLLLLSHAALLAWGAYRHSPTIDEWGHLPGGLMYWREGRCDVYRVNPPLVRLVATLPLLINGPETNWEVSRAGGGYRSELDAGFMLGLRYGRGAFLYFTLARFACIPFSLIGACVCYRWSRDLYGRRAGVVAMTLWCFSPSVLGLAQTILPDAGAAAIGLAANYGFWRWLRAPAWSTTILVGIALGLALLTKTTWVLLLGLWPVLWLSSRWIQRARRGLFLRELTRCAVIFLIALYVVNAVYGFRGSFTPLGRYQFISKILHGSERHTAASTRRGIRDTVGNRFAGTCLGTIPVPFPRDFVLGADAQNSQFESRMWSYLRGEWRRGGWWHYYLYAMGVKIPLGTLGLLLLAAAVSGMRGGHGLWKAEAYLMAPALAVLVLVSSQTGFNHHLRYVLLAFPYLFIFASKPFGDGMGGRRPLRLLAGGLLAWSVTSSLGAYPHSLSYFNESVGGPREGHAHLLASNVDYGQDLIYLREWLERHSEAAPRGIALFAAMPSTLAGTAVPAPPSEPLPGRYAVSIIRMHERSGRYSYFFRFVPVGMAGYSIYIYDISLDDANRARRELGLPELSRWR
jgi:4-amino-4-deoxy-L-arabinose transferase-like glycosyltransferase